VERWLQKRNRLVQWVGHSILSISSGVLALRSPRLLLRIVAFSLLAWITIVVGTWAMVWSVGARVSVTAIMIILPLLVLGVAVPTPAGAGSYHGAMKVGLMLFAVAEPLAVSAAIVAHLIVTIPVILFGLVLLWWEKISWHEILSAARGLKSLGEAPQRGAGEKTMEIMP